MIISKPIKVPASRRLNLNGSARSFLARNYLEIMIMAFFKLIKVRNSNGLFDIFNGIACNIIFRDGVTFQFLSNLPFTHNQYSVKYE